MHVVQSNPSRGVNVHPQCGLAAIVYADEAYPQAIFEMIVAQCRASRLRLAGVLQHPVYSDKSGHCDVALEDLSTGTWTNLFEDRGPGAGGCRLDQAALAGVNGRVACSLDANPDILILNKFGKVETEGGGLLDLIALAIARGIPVVIAVPARNLMAWREFAGGMSVELIADASLVSDWLRTSSLVVAAQGSVFASC